MSNTITATDAPKPAAPKKKVETIYVNDPDGKKFYELVGHDAMTLQPGDLLISRDRLMMVKDVDKRQKQHKITLDNGFVFDPRHDYVNGISNNMRSIRYWRPRAGF